LRQAYDYWQDQPGSCREKPDPTSTQIHHKRIGAGSDPVSVNNAESKAWSFLCVPIRIEVLDLQPRLQLSQDSEAFSSFKTSSTLPKQIRLDARMQSPTCFGIQSPNPSPKSGLEAGGRKERSSFPEDTSLRQFSFEQELKNGGRRWPSSFSGSARSKQGSLPRQRS